VSGKARRLYRFYNINQAKHGEPFCMCDFHYKNYTPPITVIMETIADDCRWPCTECEVKLALARVGAEDAGLTDEKLLGMLDVDTPRGNDE